jgi:superfamily II DNA/RNA helicase
MLSWLIQTLRASNEKIKVIALSASLPSDKEAVVKKLLCFEAKNTFISRAEALTVGPFLSIHKTRGLKHKEDQLVKIIKMRLRGQNKKGIIFSAYKKESIKGKTLEWSVPTIRQKIAPRIGLIENQVASYTGNTKPDDRRAILNDLHKKKGKIKLVLATSAFGFGVDVNNLGFSIHIQVPEDMDRFYQEISRCSREERSGYADIFYHSSEVGVQTRRNRGTLNSETIKKYILPLGFQTKKINQQVEIDFAKILRNENNKLFSSQRLAQMSADSFFGHALEALIFLFRHDVIEVLPLERRSYRESISQLRSNFVSSDGKGSQKIKHGGQDVYLPGLLLPVKIKQKLSWKKIEDWVARDKKQRGSRAHKFIELASGNQCYWRVIASHYRSKLIDKKGREISKCGHCSHCKGKNR